MIRVIVLNIFAAVSLASAADLGTDAQKASGKKLYDKYCAQCHGDKGDGNGAAKHYFKPKPRDFTGGKYKVRSTANGELPTDQDIKAAIKLGLAFKPGMAYTGMPPWPNFSEEQLMNLVYYLKTFSADFADPEYNNPKLVELPKAPAYSDESAQRGRKVFESNECIKCHGNLGRSDGRSAPTLADDWEDHIRPADLTKRWTFRAGGSREEIFKTISTGFNGTPMPSYLDTLSLDERWDLVNYVYSLSDKDEPGYSQPDSPIFVSWVDKAFEMSDYASTVKYFENSKAAYIPIVGQVVEPGREFYPGASDVEVKAVYNQDEFAVMLAWNDIQANTSGENSPTMEVPMFAPKEEEASEESDDPFADEEEDPFGEDEEDDPFADEEESGEKFSDAVAIQIPSEMPEGFKKPYFVFGDKKRSVDLWFSDLAKGSGQIFKGQGSQSISPYSDAKLEVLSNFDQGRWTVIFKRARNVEQGLSLDKEEIFVPVVFSLWDGFNEERGNKRGLTSWYQFYFEPSQKESPWSKMLLYGLGLLLVEIILIKWVRSAHKNS